MAKVINLVMDQGANVQFNITVLESSGLPKDLSGWTPTCTFKKHQWSANSHSFVCNAYANGLVTMSMNAATTANIAGGRYVYDTFIEHEGTNTYTKIQEGLITIKPSATR